MLREEMIKVLKEMLEFEPIISSEEYWENLKPIIEAENKAFAEEKENLRMSWEKFNKPFTL